MALTPWAMGFLDKNGIPYRTSSDFYGRDEFRTDLEELNKNLIETLSNLDAVYDKLTGFPYVYSSNIYWFLIVLQDLLYLETLYSRLRKSYREITPIVSPSSNPPNLINFKNLSMHSLLGLLYFDNKLTIFNDPPIMPDKKTIKCKTLYYKYRLIRYINRLIHLNHKIHLNKLVKSKTQPKKDANNIFIIQDGHEVSYVADEMKEFNFIYPCAEIKKKVSDLEPAEYDFNDILAIVNDCLSSRFVVLKDFVLEIFRQYNSEIAGRAVQTVELVGAVLRKQQPKALLYSVGANDLLETVFACTANKLNIPVVYFQHGGSMQYVNHPYQKYFERDTRIKKTQIINAKAELAEAAHDGAECRVYGSPSKYYFLKRPHRRNNKILYCCGPFPHWAYKELLFNVDDHDCYQINRDILKAIDRTGLAIDVKVHVTKEFSNYNYFKELFADYNLRDSKVIFGTRAETIMPQYSLIILEYLPTALLSLALAVECPVILYLKDTTVINPKIRTDLLDRCYLVNNYADLQRVLESYREGRLESKWTAQFVDRYLYPLDHGDPAKNIAGFITELCNR